MGSPNFNSVENLPGLNAKAVFFASEALCDDKVNSSAVFKEDVDIVPTIIDDKLLYIPRGGDNQPRKSHTNNIATLRNFFVFSQ